MDLYSPQVIKAIKQKFGFKNSKSLGQNFLTDPEVIRAIVFGAEVSEKDLVIEIGPGFGVLTDEAAKHAEGTHIGIKNVTERIEKMCHGTIDIKSSKGEGTSITIKIPA